VSLQCCHRPHSWIEGRLLLGKGEVKGEGRRGRRKGKREGRVGSYRDKGKESIGMRGEKAL